MGMIHPLPGLTREGGLTSRVGLTREGGLTRGADHDSLSVEGAWPEEKK